MSVSGTPKIVEGIKLRKLETIAEIINAPAIISFAKGKVVRM